MCRLVGHLIRARARASVRVRVRALGCGLRQVDHMVACCVAATAFFARAAMRCMRYVIAIKTAHAHPVAHQEHARQLVWRGSVPGWQGG